MKRLAWDGVIMVLALAGAHGAWGQAATTRPAPGDEVMRPTQRGLRLSPAMARAMTRMALREDFCKDMGLTEEQEQRIADAAVQRVMKLAHRNGRETGPAFEFMFAAMIGGDGKVNSQNAREFAEKMQPLMHDGRELLDGLADDARPVLSDEQFKQFEAHLKRSQQQFERLERRLADYREGKLEKEEEPFDNLEKPEERADEPKRDERINNARRSADWQVRDSTSVAWSRFLAGAVKTFKFDEEQQAQGQALLAEYRKKADAIRTDEWKARVKRNRTMYYLQWELGEMPREPWSHHLEKEYTEAIRPLTQLGREFEDAVLALARPQQVLEAIEAARQLVEKHGYTATEADLAMLLGVLKKDAKADKQ